MDHQTITTERGRRAEDLRAAATALLEHQSIAAGVVLDLDDDTCVAAGPKSAILMLLGADAAPVSAPIASTPELQPLKALAQRIREANCRPMEVSTLAAAAIDGLIARIERSESADVRGTLQYIHDTFKRDLDAGFKTRDKEFAVEVAAEALGSARIERAAAPAPTVVTEREQLLETALAAVRDIFPRPDDDKLHALWTEAWSAPEFVAAYVFAQIESLRAAVSAATKPTADLSALAASSPAEVDAFEAWAQGQKYDMSTHPLHWLFLDERTYAARQGWKSALEFVQSLLATKPAAAKAVPQIVQEALDIALDLAIAEADHVHEAYKRYKRHKHDAADRDVETIKRAIDAINPAAPMALEQALHYPGCWDTAAYPALSDALAAVYDHFKCSECAPMASDDAVIDATVEQERYECWSFDKEDFRYRTLGDLIDSHDLDLKPGDTVWLADAVRPELSRFIDADDVMTTMGERAYDIAGEHAEGYPDVTKDAERELEALLAGWISKHCAPTFWTVENVRPYRLSNDDFPNDRTPVEADFAAQPTMKGAGDAEA